MNNHFKSQSEALEENPQAAICLIEIDEFTPQNLESKFVEPHFLVIERATDPRDYWSGHLSFPGGKIEKNETAFEAAIRECSEEVGIALTEETFIDTEIPMGFAGKAGIFGLWVKPYVFYIKKLTHFKLDSKEVSAIHWISKREFLKEENHRKGNIKGCPTDLTLPYYTVGKNKVLWGYSYRILCEHLKLPFTQSDFYYGPK